jgi:ubiquinone biosynthesis protein COQ4
MEEVMATFQRSMDFRTAFRALSALLADPDDTKQAFRVAQALGGPAIERMFLRFRDTEIGKKTFAEKRVLLSALSNTGALEAMPPDSLGRAYLEFLRSQQITAEGLVEASREGYTQDADLDDDRMLFTDRLRDMHDLWHVVGGYRGDLIGEGAVLALSYAQTKNPGIGLIAFLGFFKIGFFDPGARKIIANGLRRGRAAAWLPGVDWEAMLSRPLSEVRSELGLDSAPAYDPLYTSDPRLLERVAA